MTQLRPDTAYLDTNLWVPKQLFNVEGVKNALTFTFLEGKQREPTSLALYRETETHLIVPREFWNHGQLPFEILDCRPQTYPRSQVRSSIRLDHKPDAQGNLIPTGGTVQQEAVAAILNARGGILQLGCGKGKTVVSLEASARMQVPTLIVVDNELLLYQWRKSIETFLQVPGGIGLVRGQVFDWQKWIVLTTYQTLALRVEQGRIPEEMRRWFGLVIWDEAHHINAPTFSRSADLFYGVRLGLSATPEREDGLHIIHEFHFGRVIYRDLKQDLVPKIIFQWTGLALDETDPAVIEATRDTNGEVHLSKVGSYFATWDKRLDFISNEVEKRVQQGRKVLVLSSSVAELVNLFSRRVQWPGKYTDITATKQEVGETLDPIEIDPLRLDELQRAVAAMKLIDQQGGQLSASDRQKLLGFEQALEHHRVFKKVEKLLRSKQREFIDKAVQAAKNADSGLMIHKVKSAVRMKMLREKQVVFAIMKYGREGLDKDVLETVALCEPISSKGMVQQVMGRVLRAKDGKLEPEFLIFEDDIERIRALCQNIRRHLRNWPIEDGGPYKYEQIGFPIGRKSR